MARPKVSENVCPGATFNRITEASRKNDNHDNYKTLNRERERTGRKSTDEDCNYSVANNFIHQMAAVVSLV